MNIEWKLETRKISQLKDYYKNPRTLTSRQENNLIKSLEKFGLIDKPILNLDNTIIGGHQRKRTLKKMGFKQIECWIPNRQLDEKEVEELNIRLNKNTGEWDFDVLANEFNIIELIDWGFEPDELIEKALDIESEEQEEAENESLEPGKDEEAITKFGDVYELNDHRLVCGDSTLSEYVEKCLNGNEPILMVTDPPYGVEYDPSWREVAGKGCRAKGKVQNDEKINWSLAWFLFPGDVAYVWHAGKYCSEVQKSLEEVNFQIINQIIWIKQHFALSRGDYHWQHEPCWYAVRSGKPHNWQGSRKESTAWEIANLNCFGKSNEEDERTSHSTQKPIECMSRPIINNTFEGQGVYDPFLGSGTTLIAAEKTNRVCYGLELSQAYCDIIVKRWKNYMLKNNKDFVIKRNGEVFN